MGGSIGSVEIFDRLLDLPSVLIGFGLPDDRIHAPNEKWDLDQFDGGLRTVTRLWDDLGRSLRRRIPATR
jgi:acetylornithine deacetylase/succinyl-diaminopimelate desuccinylase-like protein